MKQETATLIAPLVALSRGYGEDPAWVLAGGGNTSFKTADTLFVKASGFALGNIEADGFCEVDRKKLDAIWEKRYPTDVAAREDAALADLMTARVPGETKRPSVETLLHGFFPQTYVVHTHPTLVNGLTCGRDGESAFRRLFSERGIWVPFVDPGFTLAKAVREIFDDFVARKGRAPSIMFMQNHGLLVAGDSPEEIDAASAEIMKRLRAEVEASGIPQPDERAAAVDTASLAGFIAALRDLAGENAFILHRADGMTIGFATSATAFAPISRPYSPDHIVYAGHEYLRVDGAAGPGGIEPREDTRREDTRREDTRREDTRREDTRRDSALREAWADYRARNGAAPRIVLASGLGCFAVAAGGAADPAAKRAAATAAGRILDLFIDSCKVATYAQAFGGPLFMSPQAVAFIRNWEVEKYRASLAAR